MPGYRILSASLYRGHGLLRAEIIEALQVAGDLQDNAFHVLEHPLMRVPVRAGRIVWDNDSISRWRVLVIDPPTFPISELVGCTLIGRDGSVRSEKNAGARMSPSEILQAMKNASRQAPVAPTVVTRKRLSTVAEQMAWCREHDSKCGANGFPSRD